MECDDDQTKSMTVLTGGTTVSHYQIIKKIGSGGMGEIYLATDLQLNRRVALKFLPTTLLSDEDSVARFKREAQAAAQLNHPNIVTIHQVSEYEGRPYIVMEYIDGPTLRELSRQKKLSLGRIIEIALQLLEGLKVAHAAGIIHRDIKPANILCDQHQRCKLVDFGLAAFAGTEELTKAGSTIGTIGYMSPEQVRGENVDHRSDLFSLGVVLYELIAAKPPFHRSNEAATLNAILGEEPESLTRVRPEVTTQLAATIERLLAKPVEDRYQSCALVLAALRDSKTELEGNPSTAGNTTSKTSSVAVLPFTNLSADKEQEYFCDGIAEEIIYALNHVEQLRVVARTSSFSFKGKDLDTREIGRRLNVDTLLEGSVRKSGDRLRVIAQLVNVSDGYHLWSERFDRQIEDVFSIQDEIALTIVDRLKVKLVASERALLTKRYTEDQEAYNLYLQGRHFWNRRQEGGLQRGIGAFEQAVLRDPMYAQAYVGIADCYNQLAHWGYSEPMEAYRKAKVAVGRALAIDPSLAEAHASLGWIKLWHDWDWEGSEREFREALKLNPNYSMAHEWYALYLAVMRRVDEGVAEVRRAAELDPLSLVVNSILALGYYWARRFDDAIAHLNKTLELDPSFPQAYLYLCWAHAGKGSWPESIAAGEKFLTLTNGSVISLSYLGTVCALAGDSSRAYETLEQIDFLARGRYVSPLYRALIFVGLQNRDKAIECLELARQERESFLPIIYSFPLVDSIRDDARFVEILGRMGLHVG